MISTAVPNITSLGWAEYGLGGAVICVLFIWIFYQDRGTKQERKETAASHKEERKEWRETTDKRSADLQTVVGELKDAIKEIGRR